MKLKKLAQIMLISCGILALGACSTTKHGNQAGMVEANGDGATTSGMGQGDEFANTGGSQASNDTSRIYYFDFDRSDVRDSDKPSIFANADYLMSHPNSKIIVEGHTDPRGSREYNVGLGERRANAVVAMLKSKGVNPSQIRVMSYGAERLAVPGLTEDDYQRDRRGVIVYLKKDA